MKIRATQPFTHAGRDVSIGAVKAGDVFDLPDDAAVWLIEQGVAEAAEKEGKPNPAPSAGQ